MTFYATLEANYGAVQALGEEALRTIARQFVNWTLRENARAHLRLLVRRILRMNEPRNSLLPGSCQ